MRMRPGARNLYPMLRGGGGFTLTELVITVAVLGILAAIAVPSYLEQMNKTRRTDARRSLHEIASQLERCYSRFRAYDDEDCDVVSAGPQVNLVSREGYYAITSTALSADSYTLKAEPQGSQAGDATCAVMTLTNTELTKAFDTDGNETLTKCW